MSRYDSFFGGGGGMSRPSSRKEKRDREGTATSSDGEIGAIGPLVGVRVMGKLSGGRESKLRALPLTATDKEVAEASSPRQQSIQTNFVSMATSKSHVLCLNENGQVYACGQGIAGQLGLGKDIRFTSALSPVHMVESPALPPYVVHVACGFSQSAAITRQGRMFWWGSGHAASWTPKEVVLEGYHIAQCALGNAHILVIAYPIATNEDENTTHQGATLFGMGENKHGQLAIEEPLIDFLVPLESPLNDQPIIEIACGYQHSAALTETGQLYFWGSFLASDARPQPPTLIPLGDVRAVSCTCNSDSVLVLTDQGEVYTYGYALGEDLSPILHIHPQFISELGGMNVVSISSSTNKHAAVVHKGGQRGETEVYMWGDLDHKDPPRTVAQPLLTEELNDHRVLQIGCGQRFVTFLTDERHTEILQDDHLSHTFEKVQMSIPVRCQICSHFAFGLRHGLWKCSDCSLVCHSKCREDAVGGCEPSLRLSGSLPASPTVEVKKTSSSSKDRTAEIAEQEAKVLRRWAKAQSDFASDFVRHVSSTKLRELAPDAFASTGSPKESTRSSPLTIDRGVNGPRDRRRPESSRDSSTRSAREQQQTADLPHSLEEEPLFPASRSSSRRGSGSGIEDLLMGTDDEEDDGPTPSELDAEDKASRIQATRIKLAYHQKKVRELEEELALLLAEERFAEKISESEGEDTDIEPQISPKEPTPLSDSFEESTLHEVIRRRPSTPKGLRNRPASARPSERLNLSVEKIFIDKTWTIDPSQVQIEKQLGEGASAIVYLGQYRGQNVAIKVMKDQVGNKRLLDFQFEFQILREMKSKYNVYFYGACLNPNLCLLMEYCERGSLYSCLNDPNLRLRWPRILKIALEMCRGVSFLHSWEPQIVHRDLKSHNLLIDSNWNVKIADFGLARLNTALSRNTLSRLRGTYTYCAPEIYYGYPFTEQADVFSIGVILWEMVVRVIKGRYERPYSEFPELEYDFQIIVQTARGKRCTIPPTTPAPLRELIRSCWEVEPEARPSSRELVAAIHNLSRDYRNNQEEWDWAILK